MSNRMDNLCGNSITTIEGQHYTIGNIIGCGSQGVVYEAEPGRRLIKFYYPMGSKIVDGDILERLRFIKNIKTSKDFVEMYNLVEKPYIGYVMEKAVGFTPLNTYLIPDKRMPFSEWYNKGRGLRERIFLGYIIAKAFRELERSNLAYCDISGNNILVRSGKEAAVRMIDIDNIYIAGKGVASVLGTPRYIAPEVISRQKNPDVLSDNYSLAVILFELLRVGHPYISDDILDGTPEDEENALTGKYDYITDNNSTNMLPADIVFTNKLKKIFKKCFVDGKKNRIVRPSAREFEFALLEASNKVIKCPSCGAWHYPRKTGKVYVGCPWCDAPSKPKARLNFYDLLYYGQDYRSGKLVDDKEKLINTYVLRDNSKNIIKNHYILRYDDPLQENRFIENYVTVANDKKGYWIYNEFYKNGIVIIKNQTGKAIHLASKQFEQLETGDAIFFEPEGSKDTSTEICGKHYSFIRMARFMEEMQ